MQRLIQNDQVRILDECPGQEGQSLLSRGEGEEQPVTQVADAKHFHPLEGDLFLLGRAFPEQADGIEKSGPDNAQRRYILLIIEMHLRRDVSDAALDFPDALAGAPFPVEEIKRIRVGLWIVRVDKAQQGRFTRPVRSEEGPFLSILDFPIQVFQDGPAAIFNLDMLHPQSDLMSGGRLMLVDWQLQVVKVPIVAFRGEKAGNQALVVQKGLPAHHGQEFPVDDGLDMGDHFRYIQRVGEEQDDLRALQLVHQAQHLDKQLARGRVKANEGVVEDKDTWLAQKRSYDQEFPELATRQEDQVFGQQLLDVEQVQDLMEIGQFLELRQQVGNQRHLVYFRRVPALLIIAVPAVGQRIDILEGDALDELAGSRVIRVSDGALFQGEFTLRQIGQECLPGAVRSNDGPLLTFLYFPADRLPETELRQSGDRLVDHQEWRLVKFLIAHLSLNM